MFEDRKCIIPSCHTYALPNSDLCFHHTKDKKKIIKEFEELLTVTKKAKNVSIVNSVFENMDMRSIRIR